MSSERSTKHPKAFASKVHAELAGVYNMPSGIPQIFPYDIERYDILAEFGAGTTYTFTPREEGYYFVKARYTMLAMALGVLQSMYIDLNGAGVTWAHVFHTGGAGETLETSCLLHLTPNDAVSVWCGQNSGAPVLVPAAAYDNYVNIFRV